MTHQRAAPIALFVVSQVRDAVIECVTAVRRRETELLSELRAAFAGDPAVQAFVADRSAVEATLRGLDSTCQLTDVIVRDRSVELLLLKDDIARRMTALLATSLAQPPPRMRTTRVRFVPVPRDTPFPPLGRLDFVDDTVSTSPDEVSLSCDRKLCCRRRTARRAVSQKLVSRRNKLCNKSVTNRSDTVRGLQLIDLL